MPNQTLICFGEVLWDLLPSGKMAGGAPMNVAVHARNLGLSSKMISKIGTDDLGRELLDFLKSKGVSTDLIQVDHTFPTGIVKVELDDKSSPAYEIIQPVAWDFIHPSQEAEKAVKKAAAIAYGSLACRTERTKKTLLELLDVAALKVFDVNLRPPFFSKELLEELLSKSDIVKVNEEELEIIAGWYGGQGDVAGAQTLLQRYGLKSIIMTIGSKGALLVEKEKVYRQSTIPVTVQDTIGSGDSFLAGFLVKYLKEAPIQEALQFACATGALVATHKGGTPAITQQDVEAMIARIS